MPLYSYHCNDCESIFESRHSHKIRPDGCPLCQSLNFQKYLGKPINTLKAKTKTGSSKGQIVNQTIKETFNEIKKGQNSFI
mgnify:FL=1